MDVFWDILMGFVGGYLWSWCFDHLWGFQPNAFLRAADRADVGVVVIVVKYNINKTGILSNLGRRFPGSDPKALVLDTLRTAVGMVKGDIR